MYEHKCDGIVNFYPKSVKILLKIGKYLALSSGRLWAETVANF